MSLHLGKCALAAMLALALAASAGAQQRNPPPPAPLPAEPATPQVKLADPLAVPGFWDPRRRPERPDLTRISIIRFLTETDYPPFNFTGADGTPAGFNVSISYFVPLQTSPLRHRSSNPFTRKNGSCPLVIRTLKQSWASPSFPERGILEGHLILKNLESNFLISNVLIFFKPLSYL